MGGCNLDRHNMQFAGHLMWLICFQEQFELLLLLLLMQPLPAVRDAQHQFAFTNSTPSSALLQYKAICEPTRPPHTSNATKMENVNSQVHSLTCISHGRFPTRGGQLLLAELRSQFADVVVAQLVAKSRPLRRS